VKSFGDVTDVSDIEVAWDRSLPLRIPGSSTGNGVLDLFFGLGDAGAPQLTLPISTSGLVEGSLFYFDSPGGAPTVVGSFTACVTV
jgi:hypothetical protein